MPAPAELLAIAEEIAREAGDLAARRRREGVSIAETKSSLADIVTAADREVEELIRERLAAHRPDDGFVGEESAVGSLSRGTSGITWVVDPIDGTVNYAAGIPQYGVSIAAVDGEAHPRAWTVLAGVVASPATGEVFTASLGEGAWLGNNRLQVAGGNIAGALIATGFGYDASTHAGDLDMLGRVFPYARDLRRIGAASLDLAYVAAGRIDAYYERGLKPWDMAAGSLLVTEAGGQVGWFDVDAERPLLITGAPDVYDTLVTVLS